MKGSDFTRARGEYGQPGGGPQIIRVVAVEISTDTFENRRAAWTGSAYLATTEVITFFEPTSLVSKTLGEDEEAWVIWREAAGRWEELAAGESTGDQIIHFELTQDKSYADQAKLAKPVLTDGTLDSGADAFYVVDPMPDGAGMFYGLAAYTDGDTGAAAHDGYRGFAIKFTEDWNSTEVPGWRIIAMEGPATQLIVSLQGSYSMGGTHCLLVADDGGPWCEPFGARLPRIENDSYDVTVDDDLDLASAAQVDDVWFIHWDRNDEKYVFWRPKQVTASGGAGLCVLTEDCPGATLDTGTLTPGSGDANPLVLDDPEADPLTWTVDTGTTFTVYNSVPSLVPEDSVVQWKMIDGVRFIDVVNCEPYPEA